MDNGYIVVVADIHSVDRDSVAVVDIAVVVRID